MIGKEEREEEEQPELKVTDRRKFNVDGSLREGVTIEKEEPKSPPEEVPLAEPAVETASSFESSQESPKEPEQAAADEFDEDDAERPSSFVNFLSTLVTNAAAALGAIPHPVPGQKSVDLDSGKSWIDVITMLKEKTKGNLTDREDALLLNILSDLQMQYVSLIRQSEEKLKAQAAQKFSSKDILGG